MTSCEDCTSEVCMTNAADIPVTSVEEVIGLIRSACEAHKQDNPELHDKSFAYVLSLVAHQVIPKVIEETNALCYRAINDEVRIQHVKESLEVGVAQYIQGAIEQPASLTGGQEKSFAFMLEILDEEIAGKMILVVKKVREEAYLQLLHQCGNLVEEFRLSFIGLCDLSEAVVANKRTYSWEFKREMIVGFLGTSWTEREKMAGGWWGGFWTALELVSNQKKKREYARRGANNRPEAEQIRRAKKLFQELKNKDGISNAQLARGYCKLIREETGIQLSEDYLTRQIGKWKKEMSSHPSA